MRCSYHCVRSRLKWKAIVGAWTEIIESIELREFVNRNSSQIQGTTSFVSGEEFLCRVRSAPRRRQAGQEKERVLRGACWLALYD
jgi:hypothetical protein